MKYTRRQLDTLWELIKDKRNIQPGEYTGLVTVKFELSLDEFMQKYHSKTDDEVRMNLETLVLTDIAQAINILSAVDIKFHHLTCAAYTGIGDNSALCIHYRDPTDNRLYALAIPGVNYVPGESTLSDLK